MPFEFNKGLAISAMTAPVVIGGAANNFSTSIFNGKLYYSTTNVVNSFNTALPTVAATAVTNTISVSAFQFVMLDSNSDNIPDIMYTATEVDNATGSTKITNSVLNEQAVWENKGDFYKASINFHTKFLAAEIVADKAVIYFTSIGTAAATTAPITAIASALYKIENKLTEDLTSSITHLN